MYRDHSLSNTRSDTSTLRAQPESRWIGFGKQDSQGFVNQIQGNAVVLESEDDRGSATLQRNIIRVRGDLESHTTRQWR